jgi:tetratricopeptide (TPR) repeat protein
VRVWDLNAPGSEPLVLRGHEGWVRSVAFDPHGSGAGRLASAGDDGTVRVWSLGRDGLLKTACSLAGRNLSRAEWKKYFGDEHLHLTCPDRPIHPDYLKEGRKLASEGKIKIKEATAELTQVLKRFATQSFDPTRVAGQYAASAEVAKGDEQARAGETGAAVIHYQQTVKLDPSWRIVPATRAADIAGWVKIAEGDKLASKGDITAAVTAYEQAIAQNPSRPMEPLVRAHRLAAPGLRTNAAALARDGKLDQALADLRRAGEWDAKLPADPKFENALCWYGCLWNRATDVLSHCERAVAANPDDGGIKDSRGVARALTGDLQGAAEDFRAFLEWGPANGISEEILARRRQWVDDLNSGRNPFNLKRAVAACRGSFPARG